MKRPFKCPVCGGTQIVPRGFYDTTSGYITTSDITPERCRSCVNGIVWGDDEIENLKFYPEIELIPFEDKVIKITPFGFENPFSNPELFNLKVDVTNTELFIPEDNKNYIIKKEE